MKRALTIVAMLMLPGAARAQDPPKVAPSPRPPAATDTLKVAAGPDFGEAAAGEAIYIRYCAACHGKSLKGDGPVAAGLVKKPINLTELAKNNGGTFPYEKTAAAIDGRQTTRMHGNPDMPVWGEIFSTSSRTDAPTAESAVKQITHYVWSNQVKVPAGATPAPTPTPEKK